MVKSGIGGIAKKSRSVLGSDCGADPEVSALAVARACSSSSAIVRPDEGVDDENRDGMAASSEVTGEAANAALTSSIVDL